MDANVGALLEALNLQKVLLALAIIGVAVIASRLLSSTLDRLGETRARKRLAFKKWASIARFVIFLLSGILVVTNTFSLSDEAMLALGGTIAVTVGFALKDTAASTLAGILILIDQPFQVGDWITFDGQYGEVREIGLRSVRIVTLDDNLVTIPTNKFLTDIVASGNAGALDMQVVVDFFIANDADFQTARRLAWEAAVASRFTFLDRPVRVGIEEHFSEAGHALRIRVRAYVVDTRHEKALVSDVTARVKLAFRAHRIAGPVSPEATA